MSTDTEFTATGPADVAFQNSGEITNYQFGASLVGTQAGVLGQCTNPQGFEGWANAAGVQGFGTGPGVSGVYGAVEPGENGYVNPGPGVWGQGGGSDPLLPPAGSVNGDGVGVYGVARAAEGGVFSSVSGAQLRLVPSSVPMDENNPLMQTGQVGDLYLYTEAYEVGTTGTYHFNTILWLCVSPGAQHEDGQAVWAQVSLGDFAGG